MWRDHKIENFVRFFKTYYDFGDPNYYKTVAYQDLRERMYSEAIRDNGIYATFRFRGPFEKESCYVTILDYIKIDYPSDMRLYPDMFKESFGIKQITFSKTDDKGIQDYKYILGSCLMYNQTGEIDDKLKHVFEEIKEECVKKYNAIYSTVEIDSIEIFEETKTIFIRYIYFHIRDKFIDKLNSDDVIFGEALLPYGKWFSSDSDSTDESEKDSNIPAPANAIYKTLKNKEYINYVDCTPPTPANNAIRYCSSDAMISELLLKENKNMRMIVQNSDTHCKNTEEKQICENCRNNEGEPNPFDTCNNCHNGSEYEEKTSRSCETCRDQFRHDGFQYCDSCNDYSAWRSKLPIQENLAETIMFLQAKNADLEYRLAQCKEDNKVFPGYCMDCKNIEYVTIYDNNTKKAHTIDCCKHWGKVDLDGNTIFAETVADGYCYMFEPKDDNTNDTTGTWVHGVCDNCGYDWGKDTPTASVPEYCPKCGQKKKISSSDKKGNKKK